MGSEGDQGAICNAQGVLLTLKNGWLAASYPVGTQGRVSGGEVTKLFSI